MSTRAKNLPPTWAVARVSELFAVLGGGTPPTSVEEYWQGTVPWITSADIDDKHRITPRKVISKLAIDKSATNLVPAGSVIVVTRVGLGKVGLAEAPLCFSQDCQALLLPNGLLDARYVLFYMGTAVGVFKHISRGTTISGVTKKQLANLEFLLPPLAEQRRIVAEIEKQFTRLDAAVAALRRVQANLKRYRAAVLKAAVEGRLVPTEAELARREGRSYEPASELLKRILAERRTRWAAAQLAKFRASGDEPKDDKWKAKYREPAGPDAAKLPSLPEGWAWASWEQLSPRVTVGHVGPMKDEYTTTGVPFLRSQNVRENRFDAAGLLHISQEFHHKLSKSAIHPGDLVVVRSGSVGTTCVIPDHVGEANCADLVIIREPVLTNPWYGAYYMNSSAKRYVHAGKVGVALIHFNTKSVARLPVPLPPLPEQNRTVVEIQRCLSIADELELQVEANLKRAARLHQAVLKHALEGKLVPQDPADEPANVLLERIRAERDKSVIAHKKRATRRKVFNV